LAFERVVTLTDAHVTEARHPALAKPSSVVFANSKGGVGKSTLALMASLGLATLYPDSRVELIDLDVQKNQQRLSAAI